MTSVQSLRDAIRGHADPDPFLVLWHRAGNDAHGIAAAARAQREGPGSLGGRALRHGVECDLKWAPEAGGRLHLFLWHGPTGRERLTAAEARRREAAGARTDTSGPSEVAAGASGLISLDRALDLRDAEGLDFMVEVKRGHGPLADALAACVEAFARRGRPGRLLLAHSSLAVLEDVRRAHPDVPTLLFAQHVTRSGRALHVPNIDVLRGLRRGLLLGKEALGAVDALSPLGPFGRERAALPGMPASVPKATSAAEARRFLHGGLRGAFAYFGPGSLSGLAAPEEVPRLTNDLLRKPGT